MIPHTILIDDAKSELLDELLSDTQTDPRPIIVTRDDASAKKGETVAMLLPPTLFEDSSQTQPELYEFQLLRLVQGLDTVEHYWNDEQVRQVFIEHFPKLTFKLWKLCPEPMKRACMALDLAAKHLFVEHLTLEQIGALRHLVDLICQDATDVDGIRAAKSRLTSAGLPPMMSGSKELVDLYVEEL